MAANRFVSRNPGPSLFLRGRHAGVLRDPAYPELKVQFFTSKSIISLIFTVWFSFFLSGSIAGRGSESPGTRFERLGPFGGEVRSILMDPADTRIVYLGTSDGQMFKSMDGGTRWEQLFPGLNRRQNGP